MPRSRPPLVHAGCHRGPGAGIPTSLSRALVGGLVLLGLASPAAGQSAPPLRPSVALQADALFEAGEVDRSFALLEAHLARRPDDYGGCWRAARAALALALLADDRPEARDAWLEEAIALGERAAALEPLGTQGLFWRLAAKGRLALHQGPFRTLDLAKQVHREALALLDLDPLNAGAHDVLGRLDLEVMSLPGWKRAFARRFAGAALRDTSWESGQYHLEWAAEADPDRVLYQRDLGALYLGRGEITLAQRALERALRLPATLPGDELFKAEARQLMDRLMTVEQEGGG